jgi:hypothetical protein|tara:strand:- start:1253 stop:1453 length:201 start_codon:yes stop_codon:yes gene_type:complete
MHVPPRNQVIDCLFNRGLLDVGTLGLYRFVGAVDQAGLTGMHPKTTHHIVVRYLEPFIPNDASRQD